MERRRGRGCGARLPGRMALTAVLLASPWIAALSPAVCPAHAQTNDRIVQGKVVLEGGAPAQGAIVYLKNAKSLEVRTYISAADGTYRFAQLSTSADYEIWAEYRGKKSKEHTISSFDSKKVFTILLRINS